MGSRLPATLPMDLLLEIIACSDDVTTVVRCAMSSKTLLRAMLAFLGDRAKANGGFDPSLLLAVSYRLAACRHINSNEGTVISRRTDDVDSIVVQPTGGLRRFSTDLLLMGSSEPMSSRDGLVVLFQNKRRVASVGDLVLCDGILVANTITGRVTSLPSMGMGQRDTGGMYRPALLSIDGAGRSFELLVMYQHDDDWSLGTQIFSSREHEWGGARMIHVHNMPPLIQRFKEATPTAPVVMGRSVHWLCYTQQLIRQPNWFADRDLVILAVHAESAQATVIKLPQELLTRIGRPSSCNGPNPAKRLILATTAIAQGERRLSLVVAEALVISTWTLVTDEGSSISWSRQVVIRRQEIDKPLAYVLDAYQPISFSTFGERSGTVLFWMWRIGLVQLNLSTKKALVLCRDNDQPINGISQPLLHEINLVSILKCMKSF
ncbi:hypothetical protein BDA96_01G073700 [Sorghum bicolor]|uniref:DUF7595 domain-containing protein n=2 Tax=Sorghum bicolor TaxID=4558 RepID=A0A921RWA9_SORBI|nr:hypothetical protein BDA96_01G073700 [Sorghum bicolor]OQU90900.1 hypothetical protein SORBI_3001G071250 [Sorghum bicolor]